MPNHKSAKKRIKTDAKKRLRNSHFKSVMRTKIKLAMSADNAETAAELFRSAQKMIDQVSSKGIIHKNRAAAYKAKLANHLNSLGKA